MQEHLDVLGPAFARDTNYIRILIFSAAFQGIILGFISSAFSLSVQKLAEATWFSGEYLQAIEFGKSFDFTIRAVENEIDKNENSTSFPQEEDVSIDSLLLGNGEWWYVWLLALAGLGVGLVKVMWNWLGYVVPNDICKRFPARLPGFIEEVCNLECYDTMMAIPIFISSALSGGLGACVGPEAALLYIGSSVGTLVSKRWQIGNVKARKIGGSGGKSDEQDDPGGNENNSCSNSSAIDISSDKQADQSEVEESNDDNLFVASFPTFSQTFPIEEHNAVSKVLQLQLVVFSPHSTFLLLSFMRKETTGTGGYTVDFMLQKLWSQLVSRQLLAMQ